jgi:hypothetical protein
VVDLEQISEGSTDFLCQNRWLARGPFPLYCRITWEEHAKGGGTYEERPWLKMKLRIKTDDLWKDRGSNEADRRY